MDKRDGLMPEILEMQRREREEAERLERIRNAPPVMNRKARRRQAALLRRKA